jgi:hypothetical protein
MKDIVIGTLDFLSSAIVLVALVVLVILSLRLGWYGAGVGIAAFLGTCFVCGFWMALSKIIENQERLILLNSRIFDSLSSSEKVNTLLLRKNEEETKAKVLENNVRERAERKVIHQVRCTGCGVMRDASAACRECGDY